MAILRPSSANMIPSRADRARSSSVAVRLRKGPPSWMTKWPGGTDVTNRAVGTRFQLGSGIVRHTASGNLTGDIGETLMIERNAGISGAHTGGACGAARGRAPWFAASHTRTAGGQGGGWPTGPRARHPAGRPLARVPVCWPLRGGWPPATVGEADRTRLRRSAVGGGPGSNWFLRCGRAPKRG
jgi:hypothetical protein